MSVATLTSKGQVTIPKEVRDSLQLKSGDRLDFRVREGRVLEVVPEDLDLMSLAGSIRSEVKGVTVEAMNETIREAASKL
jgi:AbrB family looped-hinge helix DNA binding protein